MRVGIAGVGVIGGALERWIGLNTSHDILAYDPGQKRLDDLKSAEVLFVCVPVPTVGRSQDLQIVEETLAAFGNRSQRIFIRSTVLPGTCDRLAKKFDLSIYAMPEFLTERQADGDMTEQGIVVGAPAGDRANHYRMLSTLFAGLKEIRMMSNIEAELSKYMHNGNGTVRVHFNNLIYQFCKRVGADYEKVRHGALMSGYIPPLHTQVPGPDGKLGYGGKCFPKDLEALIGALVTAGIPCDSLAHMQLENERFRG